MHVTDQLQIADKTFTSRLFTGTGKFASGTLMQKSIEASDSELVTVALKRIELSQDDENILQYFKSLNIDLLPNTSGVKTAKEAVFAAQMAREALQTNWIKLEIHPDPKYLMPDPIETLVAAEQLVKEGFVVLPYVHADPVLCKRLEEVGCQAVMPLGAMIGSNMGLKTLEFLNIIIEQANVPVIIDAGLGLPSHASAAFEIGADAVLINTAIAVAKDPIAMAQSFKLACQAGRTAYLAGQAQVLNTAESSSPLTSFLDA